MQVPTITIPKDQAIAAYREYRAAVKANPDNKEDRAIMMGYRALAKGQTIIDIAEVFRRSALDEQGFPRLAIGRADWTYAHLYIMGNGRHVRFQGQQIWIPDRWRKNYVQLPRDVFPPALKGYYPNNRSIRALTPMIPPGIRPAGNLEAYHILWEAVWEAVPPKDPLLLKHLGGHLYAVLAVWNLTELERAVMGARIAP